MTSRMAMPAGTRLGPYEIIGPLGAGGMGEVYRGRDTRLGRDVAVKVVPPAVTNSPDALERFEREARAVASLSHPNILTLHDVGRSDGVSYAVMELLEGETLRARLASGALTLRKSIDIAAGIARGLAAAHDRHIAHRDIKPENVFITTDGQVKILDFGLARLTDAMSALVPPESPTVSPGTEPGVVLGTVGYMAPEQVRGESSDHRADVFGLGCVLYEMLTGRRAFQRGSGAETMTAILKEDPPEPSASGAVLPAALERIIRRCLEKRPDERFQSTRDLAFALESALDGSPASGAAARPVAAVSRRRPASLGLLLVGLVVGALASALLMRQRQSEPAAAPTPVFRRLTFERGTIRDARFTPDGQSVVYGAAWEGNPLRVFMARTESPESVRLSVPDARLLSISRAGEMAISLDHSYEGWIGAGTLARSSLLGSAPRVLAEQVREADWAPDGSSLAIVRRADGLEQLEFPIGRALYKTSGFISHIRFAPDGERIAFADHPTFGDDAGGVSVVDRAGQRTVLSEGYISVRGVAWSTDSREVWFVGRGGAEITDAIHAVSLSGQRRVVWTSPSNIKLLDRAPDGRVLLGLQTVDRRVEAQFAGATAPVDVSLRADSTGEWISNDGTLVTLTDQATSTYTAYLQKSGAAAVALGEGQSAGVSPDGRWVLALPVTGSGVLLHPTAAGETRTLPNPDKLVVDSVAWLPDGQRVVLFGQPPGQPSRGYVQDIDGGAPKPFTPAGVRSVRWWALPLSPDGSGVVAESPAGVPMIYRLAGGAPESVTGLTPADLPLQWQEDGRGLFLGRGHGLPWTIDRLDLATGRRTHAFDIRPRETAGLRLSIVAVSPNGRHYVHSYSRLLTDLFVVTGLR
jgi:Tol biopolymer transport system component